MKNIHVRSQNISNKLFEPEYFKIMRQLMMGTMMMMMGIMMMMMMMMMIIMILMMMMMTTFTLSGCWSTSQVQEAGSLQWTLVCLDIYDIFIVNIHTLNILNIYWLTAH